MMERLTDSDGTLKNPCNITDGCYQCRRTCPETEAIKRLAEYEDLEQQGLLVKLPCKVGETVWYLNYDNKIIVCYVKEFRIEKSQVLIRIKGELHENNASYYVDDWFNTEQMKECIFASKEEAIKGEIKNENR